MSGRGRSLRRFAVVVAALATGVTALSPPASAGSPYVSVSNDWVSLEVTDAPMYAVKGQTIDYRYKVRAKKNLNSVALESTTSACGGIGFGSMNNGNSNDFVCSFVATHAGMSVFNKVATRRFSGSSTKYLHHLVMPNVIDPKVEVELLDIDSNGGTWYVGQQTAVQARVINTGDVALTNVNLQIGTCGGNTISYLAPWTSQIRTCYMSLPTNQGLTARTVEANASASPDVAGDYEPSNFRATDTAQKTYDVFEPRADVGVEITNASNNGHGWSIVNPTAPIKIKLTNDSNMAADLWVSNSTQAACSGPGFFFAAVPAGESRTATCPVNTQYPDDLTIYGTAELSNVPGSSNTYSDTEFVKADLSINPLRIFNVSVNNANNTLNFSVDNAGSEWTRVYAANVTSYPGCTSTTPLPYQTQIQPSSGPGSNVYNFTCSIAPGSANAAPAIRIAGSFRGHTYIASYGKFPIFQYVAPR